MEEFFPIVGPDQEGEIVVHGCVTRSLAHGPARIPHASVQIIPVRCGAGSLLIHRRSKKPRTSPGMWDFYGGHVGFEMGILLSRGGLERAYEETALREAREELLVTVQGRPHLILKSHLRQIGRPSGFSWGTDDPGQQNVEYSTAYALCIPEDAEVVTPFELRDGSIEWLRIEEVSWDELLGLFELSQSRSPRMPLRQGEFERFADKRGNFPGFADGIIRIIRQVCSSSDMRQEVENALDWCREQSISVFSETALLSERALAEDWNRPEEDAAWSHLQQVR